MERMLKDAVVSAVVGELATRSISFLMDRYYWMITGTAAPERMDALRRLLLRVRAAVEEAEGRRITSHAVLLQLNELRKEMHRGYHTLDKFIIYQDDQHHHDQVSHHSSYALLSKFSPAKRRCISSSSGEELKRVLARLEAATENLLEFIALSGRYPRLLRQPYSMYLLLDKCMFGRQMEMEHAIHFLLQEEEEHLGVLPIVGPGKVGKSTLVEHVRMDQRVRGRFSRIVQFTTDGLDKVEVATLGGGDCEEKILIILELDGDVDEDSWARLYSALDCRVTRRGSKIIITSRSDKIVSFGTTLPLRLNYLTEQALWYYFKVRTFGSVDAEEHPKLAALAMDMLKESHRCCFLGANLFIGLLRKNFNARFWSMLLARIREYWHKNLSVYGAEFHDHWQLPSPVYFKKTNNISTEYVVFRGSYQTYAASAHSSAEAEDPMMSMQDLFFGNKLYPGRFKVAWKSHIPPHYTEVFECEISSQVERS